MNRYCKRAVLGMTSALVISSCAFPVMAAPLDYSGNTSSTSTVRVASADSDFLGGLNIEAQIFATAEEEAKSPYVNKGIAVVEGSYLAIRQEASPDSPMIGKLYDGAGCELIDSADGWAHIRSGSCEGYVSLDFLLTGKDAENYDTDHQLSEAVAVMQNVSQNIYKEPSADSEVLTSVAADDQLAVVETTEDGLWVEVQSGDVRGYIPADSVWLDIKFEEAVSLDEEAAAAAAKAAADKAAAEAAATETETETEVTETEVTTDTQTPDSSDSSAQITDTDETVWAAYSVSIRTESSADAERLGVLVGSSSIKRTGVCDNGWSRVDYNGTTGYIKSEYLTTAAPEGTDTSDTTTNDTSSSQTDNSSNNSSSNSSSSSVTFTDVNETVYATDGVNIRSSASADSSRIGSIAAGSSITRTGNGSNGWSRVSYGGTTGYIKSDYLTTTKPAVESKPNNSTGSSSDSSSSTGQQIVDYALQWVGYPYVYGGNNLSTGVDCSGFTQQVYSHFGYSIPRRASIQATVGTGVSISNLQLGDLVFYGDSTGVGHVAIYIGNSQVVHASTPTKGIIITDLNYRTPLSAKRII